MRCPQDGHALVTSNELADADGDPFLGTTVAGRFVIVGKLGAGSMGTVYRARQEAMGRSVAIKILRSDRAFDAQAKARFTREARAMSLLTSPHTVTVFDFGEIPTRESSLEVGSGGSLYLAMEMLEGESLGNRLKRLRRLRVDEALRVAQHTLMSLAEAHDKGVIHRDLKPDNLFLVKPYGGAVEEVCKVLDFGIAKVVSDTTGGVDALETQAGTVFGTPRYMSPEQAQAKPLDARSDLYSLGVILYQMLVGRAPFVDDDAVVVMARHIKSVAVPPCEAAPEAGIPQAISDVVMRVLAKDPSDRPANAKAFIAELDYASRLPPPPARPAAPAVVGTGEMTAVTREDMTAMLHVGPRGLGRRTIMLVAGGILLVMLTSAALLFGALRPLPGAARGPALGEGAGTAAGAGMRPAAPPASEPAPTTSTEPAATSAPTAAQVGDPTSAHPEGSASASQDPRPAPGASASASTTASASAAPVLSGRRPAPRPKGYTRFE